MDRLSSKQLQTFLKSNMGFRTFTLDELYRMYTGLMNMDLYLNYELMQRDSFRRKLKSISDVEGSWLVIDKRMKKTIYRAVEPDPCCKISEIGQQVNSILLRAMDKKRSWCPWLR